MLDGILKVGFAFIISFVDLIIKTAVVTLVSLQILRWMEVIHV
jgi:microcompartment protein CcmL/EutN